MTGRLASGEVESAGLSRAVAAHVVSLQYADLPAATIRATKASLLDGLGVMLAATTLGEGCDAFAELAFDQAPGLLDTGTCTLIGRGARAPLLAAALANGALSHAIDFEDAHDGAPVHPNAVQLPAVLAMAEAIGAIDGQALIAALAVGCDLVCRLGLALTVDPAEFGWYPPPILGGFGAVAACARLAGLDAGQLVDAFSLLLCSSACSAELKYSPDSHVRAVRDAFPAQAAVQAVLLAMRGVRGFDRPLEGKAGLFALYARGGYGADILRAGLGIRFHGEQLSFKPWPSCRGTHPFIEGALELRAENDVTPAQIAAIELAGHPVMAMLDAPHTQKRAPATAIDAKFSLPFTVATALVDGAVTLESFSTAGLGRPAILDLAQRVRFAIDPAAPLAAIASGTIRITLTDGSMLERHVATPWGSPENPMAEEALAAKFRACARHAAVRPAEAEIDRLIGIIGAIEAADDVGAALFPRRSAGLPQ